MPAVPPIMLCVTRLPERTMLPLENTAPPAYLPPSMKPRVMSR